jgi:hypothetical protein
MKNKNNKEINKEEGSERNYILRKIEIPTL